MKKLVIYLIFTILLIVGGCNQGVTTPQTPTPTSTPTITPIPTASPRVGSLFGIVTDKKTNQPLSGVTITMDKGMVVTTGDDGTYSIRDIGIGSYSLTFEKVGYKTLFDNIQITENKDTQYNAKLDNTTTTIVWPVLYDTYIVKNKDTNYGTLTGLGIGGYSQGTDTRILLKFQTLSSIFNIKILSATLNLYRISGPSSNQVSWEVHPITEDWDEFHTTWIKREDGVGWTNAGGTYDPKIVGEKKTVVANLFEWEKIDVTDAYTYWKTRKDYGIIIFSTIDTDTSWGFTSSNTPTSHKPYIELTYYIP